MKNVSPRLVRPEQGTDPVHSRPLSQPVFLGVALALLVTLFATYWNHFHNPFHFDDAHTIVNNTAIRDLGNLPKFFSDASTSSTLPANQAWRPGVTTLNAIDTAMSKDHIPDSYVFHISIFASYVLLGVLLFFFFYHLLRRAFPAVNYTHWMALLGTGWFWLHTANAETINYVIARTDSFSTMLLLLAFVMYFYSEKARSTYLFLLPVLLGFFVKEPTIMFAPLLLVYVWLFGEPGKIKRALPHLCAAFAMAIVLFYLSRRMTPPNWTSGGGEWYRYLATQAFVIVHYFNSFLLPVNLSADTDWTLVTSFTDDRVIAGALFIFALLLIAGFSSRRQETKPITFGILWFFIALAPTSSVFSFAEVLNDHRTFFPYIGLVLAFVTGATLLLEKARARNFFLPASVITSVLAVVILSAHAVGTHTRNNVWHDGETLWKDVTEKSPGNGRGWMNYGLALMAKNDLKGAIDCFNKALQLYPNYSYAHINMGIAQGRNGDLKLAETHYRIAINNDSLNPEAYYFYGMFLVQQQRLNEAKYYLELGNKISPQHEGINSLLAPLANGSIKTPVQAAQEQVKTNPSPDNYINLSLALYNAGDFSASAAAAEEAARQKPDYGIAWNNICAAYNKTGDFDKAEAAGKKAVELQPKDQLSLSNYSIAAGSKKHFEQAEAATRKDPTYAKWIALSLEWYNARNFRKALEAAEAASTLNPNDAACWNNICASANNLREWDKAIAAGEKAVQLDPKSELAKNNLAEARRGKAAQQ